MNGFTPYAGAFRQNSIAHHLLLDRAISAFSATVPAKIDPDVLTFGALTSLVAACALLFSLSEPVMRALPGWVYLSASVLVLVAFVLANIDFVQAKKTKSNASLSELFQQMCDLASVPLYTYLGARTLLLTPLQSLWLLSYLYTSFYFAACGHATLGAITSVRLGGPSEGVISISVLCAITCFTSPVIWQYVLDSGYLPGIQINHLLLLISISLMFWYCCNAIEYLVSATEVYLPTGKTVSTLPKTVKSIVEWVVLNCLVALWQSYSDGGDVLFNFALLSLIYIAVIASLYPGINSKTSRTLLRRTYMVAVLVALNHLPAMLGVWDQPAVEEIVLNVVGCILQIILLYSFIRGAREDLKMMIISD